MMERLVMTKNKDFLPVLLFLSLVPCCIETDVSVPGFPEIAMYFGVPSNIIGYTVSYNFLGFCIGALLYGPLAESFGRRKVLLVGSIVMAVGALGCVLAEDINILLFARLIQGLGASCAAVLVFVVIADVYSGDKAVKLIAIMNASVSALMAFAPAIGGFINEVIGWRGNYILVFFITILVLCLQLLFLPETSKVRKKLSVKESMKGYKTLFCSMKFNKTSLVPSLLCAAYMSCVTVNVFLYKVVFSLSNKEFAIHQMILIACWCVISAFADKIIKFIGSADLAVKIGMWVGIPPMIGMFVLSLFSNCSPIVITALLGLFYTGCAVVYPVIFAKSLTFFPKLIGTASSAIMFIRSMLIVGSTGFASYMYNETLLSMTFPMLIGCGLALLFYIGPPKNIKY